MGGSNEKNICGLRLHLNDDEGKVHIHDDSRGIKFLLDKKEFNEEVSDSFKLLNGKDGITKIQGDNSVSLFILCENKKYTMFISDRTSIKKELNEFIRKM